MTKRSEAVAARLRDLAARFSGVTMGHRLPRADHGTATYVSIQWIDDDGVAHDLEETLGELADALEMDGLPILAPATATEASCD